MSEIKMKTYDEIVKEDYDNKQKDLQYIRANLDKYKEKIAKEWMDGRVKKKII